MREPVFRLDELIQTAGIRWSTESLLFFKINLSVKLSTVLTVSCVRAGSGNIACAGLLTVEDFRRTIDSRLFRDWGASLALLPQEPFDPEGRDLLGTKWQEAGTEGCAIEVA